MDQLTEAYEKGRAAGERGEEAMPGCTATAYGRAWLEGYLDAFRTRAPDGAASTPSAAAPPDPRRP